MVDYVRDTGSTGKMMIRDTGSVVELWIYAGPQTWDSNMPWNYTANGTTSAWNYFNYYNSGQWMKVHSFTVSTSQTVYFRIGDTNTSGLGGPTTHSAAIKRATAPDAPTINTLTVLSSTSIRVQWSDGDDNGDTIDSRQLGYGTSLSAPQTIISSDKDTTVSSLTPGRTYYFWARTHNSEGWSPWSVRKNATTWDVPAAPSTPVLSAVTQNSLMATFSLNSNNGSAVLERQISWGVTPTASDVLVTSDGSTELTNLPAGAKIYVKARARNSVGWGAWSAISNVLLIAGAYVKVDGVWQRAVPYVKVNGVWKLAQPKLPIFGVWKGTG